ncbi:STAS domain-containing protein [Sporosarcina sp. CAU 1771]
MLGRIQHLSLKIVENAERFATSITEIQIENYPIQRDIERELFQVRKNWIELLGRTFVMSEDERLIALKEWGEEVGSQLAKHDIITLDMTLREVSYYREYIGELIKSDMLELNLSGEEMFDFVGILDRSLNNLIYFLSIPVVQYEKERLRVSQSLARELVLPIVLITDQTAILPIVGTIDYERAGILQEQVLRGCSELQLETLIIDLSGLNTTDTYIVQQLYNLFDTLTLLGIEAIVSGISPTIAQTLVNLGLTFGRVKSFATLKQALAYNR